MLMDGGRAGDGERAALFALLDERPALGDDPQGKTSWSAIASEVAQRGSASALWEEMHPLTLEGMDDADGALASARAQLANWRELDFHLVTVLDPEYPLALREIHQCPPVLFVKGKLLADDVGVSVVGSRISTRHGRGIAWRIAKGLAERGISVISGLAAGIDTAAHEATIAAGGRAVGVLGTGISLVYPEDNRELHGQVAAAGALVSQFMPDAPPGKHTFPMRNATMSGLGRASVVVEAGEYSGTRTLARLAVEHGRAVILTDEVVNSTRWGQQLRNRPGVYIAGSTADVMGIVDQVVRDGDNGARAAVLTARTADPG
jgi:DNA processing protein